MGGNEQNLCVLGIETSCDDTACAVVDGSGTVVTSVVSSQLEAHREFGGVVPEIASREHLSNWPAVSGEALAKAGIEWRDVDVIAATRGPGLIGSLLVGLSLAKSLAYGLGKPFLAVHHLEGHLYSPFLRRPGEPAEAIPDRFVGLVVSGGHSALYGVVDGETTTLAETRDDALGEVFDKVGKRLGLEYPQGPKVDELAESGEVGRFSLPVARCRDQSLDFSYSGLKTQTIRAIEALERDGVDTDLGKLGERYLDAVEEVAGVLADFRAAAVSQILDRLTRLYDEMGFSSLAVSGGAAANRLLRREIANWTDVHGVNLRLVPLQYSGDNAAMIAHAALLRHRRGEADDPLTADAASRIPMGGRA
jgi:N6-L-threonylcarbamoyladenine synthase